MELQNIKEFLISKGIKLNISLSTLLDADCVGLFSTSGTKPTFFMDNTLLYENGLQILVRHTSYLEGEKVINNIFTLLNGLEGYEPQQSPFFIGRDEKQRAEFSVNYLITKEGAY
ncbi:MAG: minor capsid protein [Paraclostridium sp.]